MDAKSSISFFFSSFFYDQSSSQVRLTSFYGRIWDKVGLSGCLQAWTQAFMEGNNGGAKGRMAAET